MINLRNDYCVVAHKEILKELLENCDKTFSGYGLDEKTLEAENLILDLIGNKDSKVYFLSGGTITNKVVLGHILKPYEAVICADNGHINVHETGAIESDGHKVLSTKNIDGKIQIGEIEKIVLSHCDEHMVKPKVVYISNTTEVGTVYNLSELKEIYKVCKKYDLYLYLDGARLASALNSKYCDITFEDLGKYTDVFYIGGTKNGLLYGEALVVNNKNLQDEIRYSIKHFGGMLAKGFITGIQFSVLFKKDLFNEIGKMENDLADYLVDGLKEMNVELLSECQSNQVFPIFDNEIVDKLKEEIEFEIWNVSRSKTTIRFVTHCFLTKKDIDEVLVIIRKILKK